MSEDRNFEFKEQFVDAVNQLESSEYPMDTYIGDISSWTSFAIFDGMDDESYDEAIKFLMSEYEISDEDVLKVTEDVFQSFATGMKEEYKHSAGGIKDVFTINLLFAAANQLDAALEASERYRDGETVRIDDEVVEIMSHVMQELMQKDALNEDQWLKITAELAGHASLNPD